MKKIAYGIFTARSRQLPIAIFNSKWHAKAHMERQNWFQKRCMYIKRIWLETADKRVYTVVEHTGYETRIVETDKGGRG